MSAGKSSLARAQWERYTRARDAGHIEYMERARRHDAYYRSLQWDAEDLAVLQASNRPALTIDMIRPTIDMVLAEHSSRRADVRFKPRRGGDQELADVLTKIYGQISDANRLDWVEAQVFSDGIIMDGRGYFDVRISYEDQWYGEVRIEALDPLDVLPDPDAKEMDPKKWQEVFITRWLSYEDIEATYGKKKANELKSFGSGPFAGDFEPDSDLIRYENRFGNTGDMPVMGLYSEQGEEKRVRAVRVVERQHRKNSLVWVMLNPETGDERVAPNAWSDDQVSLHVQEQGLVLFQRHQSRVRWTVTCGGIVLHDEWSPYDEFTVIPFFAYFRRGRPFGMIRSLISPQDQLNKASSQELHIINTMANSGWTVQSGSLVGMTKDDLAREGAKTGLVLEYASGKEKPEKILPNPVPTGLDNVSRKALDNIKMISGVPDAMRGTDSPKVSGVAIEAKQARGSLLMQLPMENLRKTRQYLAERVLALVQRFYTEERILYITDESDPEKPKVPMAVNRPEPTGQVINDLTLGEYDVVIGSAPARDSFDEIQFAEVLSMRSAGVEIPADVIVEYSHLSRKEELAKRMRALQGEEVTPEQEEAARVQAEMEMQAAQLSLKKLNQEIEKLEADTSLAEAKADETSFQPQLAMLEQKMKLMMDKQQAQLRIELAQLSHQGTAENAHLSVSGKLAEAAMSSAAQEKTANIAAAASKEAARIRANQAQRTKEN